MRKKKFQMPNNYISNLPKEDTEILEQAAEKTNVRIAIKSQGYDVDGCPLKETAGVYSMDMAQDHTPMWIAYNEMKRFPWR